MPLPHVPDAPTGYKLFMRSMLGHKVPSIQELSSIVEKSKSLFLNEVLESPL
jgi:hypothetical protein